MFQAKKDCDESVRGCKIVTPNELKKFEEVESYFVDSSGFGKDDGLALTIDQFLKKVKKSRFYAITDQGQFQLYVGEFIKKEGK